MSFPRGTTPTLTLNIDTNTDLRTVAHVYVTLKNGDNLLTKSDTDLTIGEHSVALYLNQAETLAMLSPTGYVQVNWTYADGSRDATVKARIEIDDQLLMEVVP